VVLNDYLSEISDVISVGALVWQRVNSRHSVAGFVTYRQDGPRILSWHFTGELAVVWSKDKVSLWMLCKMWSQM
jgi:hypothetical protein